MDSLFKTYLSKHLDQPITAIKSIAGGDISLAYKIETSSQNYFLKVNSNQEASPMFQAERRGLETIAKTNTINVPHVYFCGSFKGNAFLLMEFIESKLPDHEDFFQLGKKLAELHQHHAETFGLNHDNFIGTLPQNNHQHKTWTEFYINERLLPQLEISQKLKRLSHQDLPNKKVMTERLGELFSGITPSLVHGDLWNGNFLISKDGVPFLIDPAIGYAHYEVDLAMSRLFGGFGDSFYEAHANYFPLTAHQQQRMEIYQLYYLLVHLNLFGRPYYPSVKTILDKYF